MLITVAVGALGLVFGILLGWAACSFNKTLDHFEEHGH
jgi:ABC-type dipeptide/oligopeptide/nickel transport system permease subunit